MGWGVYQYFPSENFVAHCRKKTYTDFVCRKSFCIGWVSHDICGDFLSHTTEKLREETLLCFKNFPVSKKIMDKKDALGGKS